MPYRRPDCVVLAHHVLVQRIGRILAIGRAGAAGRSGSQPVAKGVETVLETLRGTSSVEEGVVLTGVVGVVGKH